MKEKLPHKMLLIGLMLNVVAAIHPAAAPNPLPENISDLRQMFAPGSTGTKYDFEQLPLAVQNKLVAELLIANNNDVQETFFHALQFSLSWAIQPLLDRGTCPSLLDSYSLMIAAQYGNTKMVDALTSAKATIYYGPFGLLKSTFNQYAHINHFVNHETALMHAARNGHTETVKLLLSRRAEVNRRPDLPCTIYSGTDEWGHSHTRESTYKGYTALLRAAQKGHAETIKLLIDAKAQVNITYEAKYDHNRYFTALMEAAESGHTQAVKVLINAKAKLDVKDDKKSTALIHAARSGKADTVKALTVAKANVNAQDKDWFTALMYAARRGATEVVEALINAKAKLDIIDSTKMSALMHAARSGQTEAVKVLIDAKAQIDSMDNKGFTALMHAASNGHTQTVKALTDAKALIDTYRPVSKIGKLWGKTEKPTALGLAVRRGHVTTAQAIADGYRNEVARSSCHAVRDWENKMQQIHDNFIASTQRVSTKANDNDDDDKRGDFEQLPNTFLQTMSEYLTLANLAKLRRLSRTCRIITQFQFEKQLRPHLIFKFQDQQEDRCRAFVERETRDANLPNPLTVEPFDYWESAQDVDLPRPSKPRCAIA